MPLDIFFLVLTDLVFSHFRCKTACSLGLGYEQGKVQRPKAEALSYPGFPSDTALPGATGRHAPLALRG